MDFIWVPESGSGKSGGDAGTPLPNEFTLFLCGFVVLAGCAALGSMAANGDMTVAATKYGMSWVVDLGNVLLRTFPGLGYMFVTTGALVGVSRSTAPLKRRLIWLAVIQAVAVALLYASSLH